MKFGTIKFQDNSRVKYLDFNSVPLDDFQTGTPLENRKFMNLLRDTVKDGLFIYSDTTKDFTPENSLGVCIRINKGNTLNFRLYYRSETFDDIERYSDYIREHKLKLDIIKNKENMIIHVILRRKDD